MFTGLQSGWRGSLFGSICYWLEIRLGLFLGYCLVTLMWYKVLKSRLNGYENDFVDYVKWLEILNLAFTGCYFIWNNKHANVDFVARKLDRVMGSVDWLDA